MRILGMLSYALVIGTASNIWVAIDPRLDVVVTEEATTVVSSDIDSLIPQC